MSEELENNEPVAEEVVETTEPVAEINNEDGEEHEKPIDEHIEAVESDAAPAVELDEDGVPRGVRKRIDKLTAEKKALAEQLEAYRKQQTEAQLKQYEGIDAETGAPLYEPRIEDFEDWRDYAQADKQFKQKKAQSEQLVMQERQRMENAQQLMATFEKQKEVARKKYDDFDTVDAYASSDQFPISQGMADVILGSPNGGDLYYWLGKNPSEAAKLASMSPIMAAKEMGKIESQFAQPTKIKTSAPKPLQTESAGRSTGKSVENMTQAELTEYLGLR